MTDCVRDSRTLDVLLRRGGDLPLDAACAVLGPVADTLDALHRRGRSHGAVSATQITVTLQNGELGVELSEPVDGPMEEPTGGRSAHGERGTSGHIPCDIPGDYLSFGSLVVRCLVRTLGPDDRRVLARGLDPVTGRRATSCAALVDAARVAVVPLPGDVPDASGFWENGPTPLASLRAGSGGGPAARRSTARRWRRPVAIGCAVLGVVAVGSVLVARASGGSTTVAVSTSTTTRPENTPSSTTTTRHTSDALPSTGPAAGPTTLPPGTTGAADTLTALVPTALRGECRASGTAAATRAEDLALAVLECGTDEIPVRYSLFADAEALDAAYRASAPAGLRGPTALSGPPRCLDGEAEERAWSRSAGDPEAGRYRCEIDSTGASVVWTTDSVAVLARASAQSGEPVAGLGALYRLWRTVLGPVTP